MPHTKVITWNVRGMHTPTRRYAIYAYLKRHAIQIAMLQETHLTLEENKKLRNRWRGQLWATKYSAYARGAAVWVRAGVPFVALDEQIDQEGRFVMVRGKLDGRDILLGSIYAPNVEQNEFWQRLSKVLAQWKGVPWLLGGDFNTGLDINLDRSFPPLRQTGATTNTIALQTWLTQWELTDVWRYRNPADRVYSFYSPPHGLHTRLDRLVTTRDILPLTTQTDYMGRTHSDHNPQTLTFSWEVVASPIPTWRLQPAALEDSSFREAIGEAIEKYFQINEGTASTVSVEWDAFKTVLRGQCIGIQWNMRKQLDTQIRNVEQKLMSLEARAVTDTQVREELTEMLADRAGNMEQLRCLNFKAHAVKTHDKADKSGTILAWLIKQETTTGPITSLQTTSGNMVYTQQEIHKVMVSHYSTTYQKRPTTTKAEIMTFLSHIELPNISNEEAEEINTPLTEYEIKGTITSLKGGKTPGPDGLPAELYKVFSDQMATRLCRVYSESIELRRLPDTMCEATLVSLLKPSRDPTLPGSYRPLALLNTDYKILAKTIANRIGPLVPRLVHEDQNGFVPTRSTSLNIRRFFRVSEYAQERWPRSGCLVLDLEKAFDSVEWPYLFYTLHQYGLGSEIIQLIELLYTRPKVRIKTNGMMSEPIEIFRGTRQGCPASPLLFALAIEPLAHTLRQRGVDWGIPMGDGTHVVSLYADDLLIYLRDITQVPTDIMTTLDTFAKISGLKINWGKTCLYPFCPTMTNPELRHGEIRLPWCPTSFRYLGIRVYHTPEDVFAGNLDRAITALTAQITFWRSLPLSVMGRIALIKMVLLPRLLYYFSNIPINIPRQFFRKLETTVRELIWHGSRCRVALSKLYAPLSKAGLAVPNIEHYYLAAQLQWITKWLIGDALADTATLEPPWAESEILQLFHPCSKGAPKPMPTLLRVAHKIYRRVLKLTSPSIPYAPATPLAGTPRSKGVITTNELAAWSEVGITTLGDLYHGGELIEFNTLVEEWGLHRGQHLMYNTLRAILHKEWGEIRTELPMHDTIQYLYVMGRGSKLIHWLTVALRTQSFIQLTTLRGRWETDRTCPFTDKEWEKIIESPTKIPRNSRFKLIQCYIVQRAYLTPQKINKYYNRQDAICPRCREKDTDLLHMLWHCPKLQEYWSTILTHTAAYTSRHLETSWEGCILGLRRRKKIHKATDRFIDLSLLVAKRLITKNWRAVHAPTFKAWKQSMLHWAQAESTALHIEEIKALRKFPIAQYWDTMLLELRRGEGAMSDTDSNTTSEK